ncbi:MAG TPA: hypothetical protein VLB80_05285, partial [Candidatus Babeliales bacterium]|nr:hypothetical protein [Candidatus Babeliales bacterium]
MKDKIILTLHIHVLLFILVTPLTLLYSQQQISPGKRPAGLPKPQRIEKIIERKQATPVMITTPAQQKNEPSITNNESEIVTNSQDEQNNEESINKEEQKNEKNKENASLKSTTKAISESTPESQPTPS